MTAWVLLLRGINVGGAGKLPMASLKDIVAEAGGEEVATYIQSGNAVFASAQSREALAKAIGGGIEAKHGFRPGLFLLTAGELVEALDGNPWPEAEDDPKPMHLFFHDGSAKMDEAALDALKAPGEAWKLTGAVLYFRAPEGIGRSKFIEKLDRHFKATKTGRNLRTCRKLLEMAQSL